MINTVLGPIDKEKLGLTLAHEHIQWISDEQVSYDMYYSNKYNDSSINKSFQVIFPLLMSLKEKGIQSVVEASPPIGGQNIKLLYRLSKETGVHIIPCTGWNVAKEMIEVFPDRFKEQLVMRWVRDYEEGLGIVENHIVRPSYIKLLFSKGQMNKADKEMLKAAIETSKITGMAIHCHILQAKSISHVLELLEENNMDMSRFIWAHADKEADKETIIQVLERGAYIGIDNVVNEHYKKCFELLKWAIEMGYKDRIFLSEDLDFYEEAMNKNGSKSGKLISDFFPYCNSRGISKEVLDYILRNNPAEFYNI